MKMIPVKSSNTTHVGHHGTTLHVSYKGGAKYRFEPVTGEQYNALLESESKGKFLNSLGIKGKKI